MAGTCQSRCCVGFEADNATRDAVIAKIARAAWDETVKTRQFMALATSPGQPGTIWVIIASAPYITALPRTAIPSNNLDLYSQFDRDWHS